MLHISKAYIVCKKVCIRLRDVISKQYFVLNIRGFLNNKVIFKTTIKPLRKNVIGKCYGGDITRKRKLIEKQKKGKKKLLKNSSNILVKKNIIFDIMSNR